MVANFLTTISNAFSWMNMYKFRLRFHRSLFSGSNIPALFQIMVWHRPGDKPLSKPMEVSLPTHICVTRPQRVNASRIISCTITCRELYFFRYRCSCMIIGKKPQRQEIIKIAFIHSFTYLFNRQSQNGTFNKFNVQMTRFRIETVWAPVIWKKVIWIIDFQKCRGFRSDVQFEELMFKVTRV